MLLSDCMSAIFYPQKSVGLPSLPRLDAVTLVMTIIYFANFISF